MIQECFCDGFSCVNEDLLELHMKSHTRHIEKVFRRYGYSYVHLKEAWRFYDDRTRATAKRVTKTISNLNISPERTR